MRYMIRALQRKIVLKVEASIAQSVEQGIENPRVPGSIPGRGTIFRKALQLQSLFSFSNEKILSESPSKGSQPAGYKYKILIASGYGQNWHCYTIGELIKYTARGQ
ncbi:hypothetical protein ND16A_2247 [Thalassotalea sp. ND16A]|nr:hypothetical protein ND16A_2247 [Thalassotalea sp. ND16A]